MTLSPARLEEPRLPLPTVITKDQHMIAREFVVTDHRDATLRRPGAGRTPWADKKRHTELEPANDLAKS